MVDLKAAGLLLTAAMIVKDSIAHAHDESEYSAVTQVMEAVVEKKRVMKDVETYVGPPLLDSESGRLVRISIEGAPDI